MIEKLTLEDYLGRFGCASPVDDFMIDKLKIPHGETQNQKNQRLKQGWLSSKKYHEKREEKIREYYVKVEKGEIVVPTIIDRTIRKATYGHPDNPSTQAAIRMLQKRGYIKNQKGDWVKSNR